MGDLGILSTGELVTEAALRQDVVGVDKTEKGGNQCPVWIYQDFNIFFLKKNTSQEPGIGDG
jgi:hypothetical protein